jgi:outer membrane immunogenic protein
MNCEIDMKSFAIGFIVSYLAIGGPGLSSALAADLTAGPPVTATFGWTGGYFGPQAGYGWGKADHRVSGLDETTSNDVHGELLGVYGGYNYQFSNDVVIGIDADIVWSDQRGGPDTLFVCSCAPDQPNKVSADLKWSAAVRSRLGYAVGGFLPYISGGLAIARVHGGYDYINADGDIDDTKTGWTLGAGVDYAFTDNLIFRGEYRYSNFGDVTAQPFLPAFADTHTLHFTSHDLRVGIAYKF